MPEMTPLTQPGFSFQVSWHAESSIWIVQTGCVARGFDKLPEGYAWLLERAGFVVMQRAPIGVAPACGRGCDRVDLNPSQTATLETEICGQRLWARRAEKSRLNAPNRLLRPVFRAQATETSCYF
jgi:hypothetical protein